MVGRLRINTQNIRPLNAVVVYNFIFSAGNGFAVGGDMDSVRDLSAGLFQHGVEQLQLETAHCGTIDLFIFGLYRLHKKHTDFKNLCAFSFWVVSRNFRKLVCSFWDE